MISINSDNNFNDSLIKNNIYDTISNSTKHLK